MIDDAVLEELFRSAAETIEVPLEGPAHVLAARDALISRRSQRDRTGRWGPRSWGRRPRLALLAGMCALIVIALAVSVVEASGGSAPSTPMARGIAHPAIGKSSNIQGPAAGAPSGSGGVGASAGSSSGSGTGGFATGGSSSATSSGLNGAASPALSGPEAGTSPNMVPTVHSKVVKTGSASLQVGAGQLSDTLASLSADATGLGGFVASSTQTSGSFSSGNVTLRVPAASFDVLVGDTQRLGKVTALTTAGEDVTSQYVDLQARINSLEDARTQFQQILSKAQSIGDILSVESQIADLQTQIEQLQGQLQVLNDQATYSTLTVQISEVTKVATPPRPKAPSGLSKAWAHARHSFTQGVEGIVGALGGVAVFILFVAALAVLARLGWTYLRRRMI